MPALNVERDGKTKRDTGRSRLILYLVGVGKRRIGKVQTWKPITGDLEHPVVGWVLGTLFPDFDARARPIKRRVTHAAITTLPIEFRPALLAGLARVLANPAMLRDLRKATLLRGQRNFDKFCREAKFELPEAADASHQ
jgi:hypothetical protein